MINSLISEVSSLTEEVEEIKQKNVRIHIHTQTYNFRGKFRKFSLCSDENEPKKENERLLCSN